MFLSMILGLILYVVIYGCPYGAFSPLRASVMADHFGRRAYGAITAGQGIPVALCAGLGPLAAGWLYDVLHHYDLAFYLLSVRNAARYVQALVPPPPGVRGDFEVLLDLALAVRRHGGGRQGRLRGLMLRAIRALGERRLLDLMLRLGPHKLSLRKLLQNPHGIDLGPLRPQLPGRLYTRDQRMQLAPEIFLRDLQRLEASLAQPADALVLIGRRALRSNNSWMHNSRRLMKGPDRCTAILHPRDAGNRGLADGDRVRVVSRVGAIELPLEVSDEIRPGVISIPHGFGHGRRGVGWSVAAAHAGASVNDITDPAMVDRVTGNAAMNAVPVRVQAG